MTREGDTKLLQDIESAMAACDDEEIVGHFQPGSNVDHQQAYGFSIFQDYALLNETEFTKLCHMTPAQAGYGPQKSKKQALTFGLLGPKSKEKFYMVGLQGLSAGELASVRKIRVEFRDSVAGLKPSER